MNEFEVEKEERSQPLLDYNPQNQMIEYTFEQTFTQIDSINNLLLSLSQESSINCKNNLLLLKSSMNHLTSLVSSLNGQLQSFDSDLQFKFKLISSSTNLNNKYEGMKKLYHETSRYFVSTVSKEQQLTKLLDNSSEQTEAQSKNELYGKGTKVKSTDELKEIKAIDDYFSKATNAINAVSELCGNKTNSFNNIDEDIYLFFDNSQEVKHEGFKLNNFIIFLVMGTVIIFGGIFLYLKYCVQFAK